MGTEQPPAWGTPQPPPYPAQPPVPPQAAPPPPPPPPAYAPPPAPTYAPAAAYPEQPAYGIQAPAVPGQPIPGAVPPGALPPGAPPGWPGAYPPPTPPKKRSVGKIIAIVVAIVVVICLIAGGLLVWFALKASNGQTVVEDYFTKLSAGDATGALKDVQPPTTGQFADYPMLTAAAIADAASRPTGLSVASRTRTTSGGSTVDAVTVTYTAGGTSYTQVINAVKQANGLFLLDHPFFILDVTGPTSRDITVNGVAYAPLASGVDDFAFPGAYTADSKGDALIAEAKVTATLESTTGTTVTLPAKFKLALQDLQLADGAKDAIDGAIKDFLAGCLTDHTLAPNTHQPDGVIVNCPFSLNADVDSLAVNWSIASYPATALTVNSDGTVTVISQTEGIVAYDVPDPYIDSTFPFPLTGTASVKDGKVVFTVATH